MSYQSRVWVIVGAIAAVICAGLAIVLMTSDDAGDGMYIEPAQLSESEQGLVELLGANNAGVICDFQAGDTLKSVHIKCYELTDGGWQSAGPDSCRFEQARGRLAVTFADKGMRVERVAVQGQGSYTASERQYPDAGEYGA